MENPVDKRNILGDEVFSHRITKDRKVFIFWHGKHITSLCGSKAEEFISSIDNADGKGAQLIMAKATGHFKHGNERLGKQSKRNS